MTLKWIRVLSAISTVKSLIYVCLDTYLINHTYSVFNYNVIGKVDRDLYPMHEPNPLWWISIYEVLH